MANHGKYNIAIRLLLLKQYLEANAGESRVVKRSELEEFLRKNRMPVEKKTLYSDLVALENVFGMQLEYDPHKKGYRLLNPPFEMHDLRVMVDSVQAFPFITEKEANTITAKIKDLAPENERSSLSRYVEVEERVSRVEESILRKVDILHNAIQLEHQIQFRYFEYKARRDNQREYARAANGSEYITVSPRKIVLQGNCYCLKYYPPADNLLLTKAAPAYFEVSRMTDIHIINKQSQKTDFRPQENAYEMANKLLFGKEVPVTIRFRNNYIQDILEHFGQDTPIIPLGSLHFKIVVKLRICPEDFQPLLSFGCAGKVIAPPQAVRMMNDCIQDMQKLYESDQEPYYVLSQKELDEQYMPSDDDDYAYMIPLDEDDDNDNGEM